MTTAILQMGVLLACALAFAGYLLHLDRKDKHDARQAEINFTHSRENDHHHKGAAMSRL